MSWNPFSILRNGDSAPPNPNATGSPTAETLERVSELVESAEVFVFMKGSPDAPACGYSANTISILKSYGVPFASFDVLSSPDIREAAKKFGQWPTFPQVYARGELVGGDDIISEMHANGELGPILEGSSS